MGGGGGGGGGGGRSGGGVGVGSGRCQRRRRHHTSTAVPDEKPSAFLRGAIRAIVAITEALADVNPFRAS